MNAIKHFLKSPKEVRKASTALVACIGLAVAHHVVPSQVGTYITVLEPLLVAYGVWKVPNASQEA